MVLSRRDFGLIAGGAVGSLAFGQGCGIAEVIGQTGSARLSIRPRPGVKTTAKGTTALGLGSDRDAILRIPPGAGSDSLPLLVLLHGAGGSGDRQLRRFGSLPEEAGLAVLAPDSRRATWDAIRSGPTGFGADIAFLGLALERVFETVAVDPDRVSIGGFSDGATYALSVGLSNGDLFRRIAAFSPGFIVLAEPPQGKPRVFVSHGTSDDILPIDRCSRVLVPKLKAAGYDVAYREFEGGHEVPPPIARDGLAWAAEK